jgi:hypothetical protein
MRLERLHVLMLQRNHLFEAGVHAQLRGEIRHRGRYQGEYQQHRDAIAEYQRLGSELEAVWRCGCAGCCHGLASCSPIAVETD